MMYAEFNLLMPVSNGLLMRIIANNFHAEPPSHAPMPPQPSTILPTLPPFPTIASRAAVPSVGFKGVIFIDFPIDTLLSPTNRFYVY